jgi:hypothetical protein
MKLYIEDDDLGALFLLIRIEIQQSQVHFRDPALETLEQSQEKTE